MPLMRAAQPFDHPDWLFELKHDGFRALAYLSRGGCSLISRRGNTYKSVGPLRESLSILRAKDAVLDGEIVCLDQQGRSVFKELLYRRGDPAFYAFDLVWLNGRDLKQLPLTERKRRLARLIHANKCERVICGQHLDGEGVSLFRVVCEANLEGIVAKHKQSVYSSVPSRTWLKIKNPS